MITLAQKNDWPRMVEVWESAVKATHDFLSDEDFCFYKSRLISYFSGMSLFVYKDIAGRIVGFVGVADGAIEMLFVDDAYRGKGIGKSLLLYAVESLGTRRVDVNEQNRRAADFYTHLGFRITGRSPLDGEGKPYPLLHLEMA